MSTTLTRTGPAALDLLAGDPFAPAILTPEASVDYAELADRIADRRVELGAGRRLVFLSGSNTLETVVIVPPIAPAALGAERRARR
jgi:hypothetical protein